MSRSCSPEVAGASPNAFTHSSEDEEVILTPRTKIKALLAGLEDSDDETTDSKRVSASRPRLQLPTTNPFAEDSDEEEDEDVVIAPRGRLAARMQAQSKPMAESTSVAAEEISPEDRKRVMSSEDDRDSGKDNDQQRTELKKLGKLLKRKRTIPDASPPQDATISNIIGHSPLHTVSEEATVPPHASQLGNINVDEIDSEEDLSINNNRFLALVEKKRAERLAKEAAEEAKRAEKLASKKKSSRNTEISDIDSDADDSENGAQLTQKSRPARKAGKKAIEEMARETQRISRNMQLAHEAKTKKKITKESLLARFKPKPKPMETTVQPSSSTVPSSAPNSDGEGHAIKGTPPTSPDQPPKRKPDVTSLVVPESPGPQLALGKDLPDLSAILTVSHDKGKGKALDLSYDELHPEIQPFKPFNDHVAVPLELPTSHRVQLKQRPIRLLPPKNPIKPQGFESDSGDDLEVVQSKIFKVFDNLPMKKSIEGKAMLNLRALARLTSPSKRNAAVDKSVMNGRELAVTLKNKARQQAAAERAEKIEILRSKGIIIQSAEERQRDQMDVEDLLEKARKEDEELTKREKEFAKKEAQANGKELEDSSEDEDYKENEEEDDDQDVELSGSEDEASAADGDEASAVGESNGLIDDAASETDAEDNEASSEASSDEVEPDLVPVAADLSRLHRQRRRARIIDDEDDDEENSIAETLHPAPIADSPQVVKNPFEPQSTELLPTLPLVHTPSILDNPFGPQSAMKDAPMGLTQAFAATMSDSQQREGFSQEESLAQLVSMPSPNFPVMIPNSIEQPTQQNSLEELDLDLHFTQTQIQHDTLQQPVLTQLSEMPDPTQDAGFQQLSPLPPRFVPAPGSTIDTVIVPPKSTPVSSEKQGKLIRKQKRAMAAFSDEEDADESPLSEVESADDQEGEADNTAFQVMTKAAKRAKKKEEKFNKEKSEAKGMFEEQAQESEDEYAGLGGASDDSEGEEDEEIREMIDESEVNVNERKVAAYFAEKEREENEAGISKLYKDINSGALRRKRGAGADFDDLEDSDDDFQARRARKQKEYARMQKALFDCDSNVVKIAEDPKKLAFLRAIEDREDVEDDGFLDSTPREQEEEDLPSQDIIPYSQAENRPPGFAKRKRDGDNSMLPPAKHSTAFQARRVPLGGGKKPATLAEIRDSLSFLTDEPDSQLSAKFGPSIFDASSDVELEEEEPMINEDKIGAPDVQEQRNPRRTGPRSVNPKFVDRLSLKRQESSRDSQTAGNHLAFMDPKFSADRTAFKPATLLRKATSSFSTFSNEDEHGISTNNNAKQAVGEPNVKGRGVGGGGSKRSSVNWYSRDAERKAALEKRLGKSGNDPKLPGVKRQGSGLSNLLGKANAWE